MTPAPDTHRGAHPAGLPGADPAAWDTSARGPAASPRARSPRRRTVELAGLAGLVAVLAALLMPLAPVSVNQPTVSWPRDPARPESTLLSLTAYRPVALDVRFSCDVARLAQTAGSGVVISTAQPADPQAGSTGMIVTASGGRVQVRGLDRLLLDEPLPAGPCEYRITGRSAGLPSYVRPPLNPADPAPDLDAFAGIDNAKLVISRDGRDLIRTPAEQLPGVDMLVTSLPGLPADIAGDLAVELRVDDEFTSSPTPLKSALTAVLVLALLATAVLLAWLDRTTSRASDSWRAGWPRIVDVAVPAVLIFWAFVAPATDDDGYFAAQARNATISGEVGNYYQLYDQSFTPFTWPYQGLAWWQQLVGQAPVAQRIPALAFGLLTWLVLRRFAVVAMAAFAPHRNSVHVASHAVLGVVFLAWWLPQNMGVRPEAVVALCGAATMLAVLVAARRQRLTVAWLACVLAGFGFTAHTTGVTLLAPLLAGLPLLLPLVRVPRQRMATALRILAVGSGAMVAPLLAFADGALRDFLRGQVIFLSIRGQEGVTSELQRYGFLLDQIPMGNFAKRAAVLACLVALGWFAVLTVAARMRRVALPAPLWLAGSSTALAFAALSLTPSKWSHHFGALAGVGPAFLGLMLVMAVPLTRQVLRGARLPIGVLVAAAGSFVVAIGLAWHGPNDWPYAWLDGVRTPYQPPSVGNVTLDSPLLWGLAVVLVALALVASRRRSRNRDPRLDALRAVPIVVVASLAATTGYVVGTFGFAAAQGVPRESIWARAFADPTGADCGAAGAVRVLDPFTAQPLPAAGLPAPPAPDGFIEGGGYYTGNPPQGSATDRVWGSLVTRDDQPAERTTGKMATGWYALPANLANDADADGAAVTVLAAGTLTDGNSLAAVYGQRSGDSVITAGSQPLTGLARDPSWRTFTLTPPEGADVVRLDAVDATGAMHGWLAFTVPAVAYPIVLQELLSDEAPVALGWQLAFAYPCQRQPEVVNGITEPPSYAVLWGDGALAGLTDPAWRPQEGGAFGHVARTQPVLQLATVGAVNPYLQVYAFGTRLGRDGYTLTTDRRTVAGASTGVS
ncbi:MAG: arabinosyltransferase domain-containing protein [Actinomycetota bacterium]|nr:arabinosyltransferase domain-containing protein [Actinomycetota bacterium]